MFRVALFITAPNWKQPKHPFPVRRRSKLGCAATTEDHTTVRTNRWWLPQSITDSCKHNLQHKEPDTRVHPGRSKQAKPTSGVRCQDNGNLGSRQRAEGERGGFCGAGKVLFPGTGSGYAGVLTLKIHPPVHIFGFRPFSACVLHCNKYSTY